MRPPHYSLYVALGDSTTEGLDDPYPGGHRYRGWADRLAEHLSTVNPRIRYANLAVRGRKIGRIHDTQLGRALAMGPDLASVVGGVNDVLRPRVDLDFVADRMERMQSALISAGATVVAMTLPDLTSSIGITRLVHDRVVLYNDLMRQVAARTGALMVDVAAEPQAGHPSLWSVDRLHGNTEGHRRIAASVARALGVPGVEPVEPLPDHRRPPTWRAGPADAVWFVRFMAPWIMRRLRGASSGDGIAPKRVLASQVLPYAQTREG